ncbi:MAG: phosphatidate cytidylyltransferase [Bacteroidetes bacterium]|nr:phosphatidate cytidylyltransferase [Bacteroidota bacterium]
MSWDIINMLILALSFLTLFGTAELLHHLIKVKAEFTRKFVHIGTGFLTLLFPVMLGNHWLVFLLCSGFAILLISSLKFNLLKSINAIDRESFGSIVYPASVYLCYLAFDYTNHQYLFFYLPILILAVCDPIAALTGKKWPKGKYKIGKDDKTLMGSSMFFLSAMLICLLLFMQVKASYNNVNIIIVSFVIALTTALTEAISIKGYDNITIPASALLTMFLLNNLLSF